MSLDLSTVGYTTEAYEFKYDWKTVALYALGIGAKKAELDYVFEGKGPKVYPTFSVVPTYPAVGEMLVKTGGNLAMVIHGAQTIRVKRPIPSEGTFKTTGTLKGIYDMKKMAQVVLTTSTTVNGEDCFETDWGILIRGAGDFGGAPPPKNPTPSIPDGKQPDFVHEEATAPEQALLYRLSGDLNPLHADPAFAAMVGFPQGPILHGLCTYGFVARAVILKVCGGDGNKLAAYGAQFRKPVWPGESIRTEIYDLGGGKVAMQAFAADRPDPVLANAWAEVR
jgi:acyl dehydratase